MTQLMKHAVLLIRHPCGCMAMLMDENNAKPWDIYQFYGNARRFGIPVEHLRPGEEMPPWECPKCKPDPTLFTEGLLT